MTVTDEEYEKMVSKMKELGENEYFPDYHGVIEMEKETDPEKKDNLIRYAIYIRECSRKPVTEEEINSMKYIKNFLMRNLFFQ